MTEYAIAVLGSIESGLVVTTINPLYTSLEISRQFKSCQPKAVFCLVDNFEVVKNACNLAQQPTTKMIVIKTDPFTLLPTGAIDFSELINFDGIVMMNIRFKQFVRAKIHAFLHFRSQFIRIFGIEQTSSTRWLYFASLL